MERAALLDHAKKEYAARILDGVGKVPALTARMVSSSTDTAEGLKKSWELKQIKNSYRFNEKQKSFLVSKFNIGQDGKWKMENGSWSCRKRNAPSRIWIFNPGPNFIFFFKTCCKDPTATRGEPVEEDDLEAATEEDNFATARESVLATFQMVHPIICDQQNVCASWLRQTLLQSRNWGSCSSSELNLA